AEVGPGCWDPAEAVVDLVDRPRHDEPEEAGDQPDEDDVVEPDTDPAGDAALPQRLHRRPHRRRENEGEEEQRREQPQLPDGEGEHDDAAGDEGGKRCPLSGRLHSASGPRRRDRYPCTNMCSRARMVAEWPPTS